KPRFGLTKCPDLVDHYSVGITKVDELHEEGDNTDETRHSTGGAKAIIARDRAMLEALPGAL
uniref:hypothetical protein n=1 Tax=Aeromonas sp. HMWF014 TaxID=2056850 RepID=UPI000D4B26E2